MFSLSKPFLIYSNFQYIFRCCQTQSTKLVNFLMTVKESPPKPNYSCLFFDEKVQNLLKKVSNIELEKVFQVKPRGKKLKPPVYKFLTTEELQEEMEKASEKANYLLQIPPLVNISEDKSDILDDDTSLDGFDVHHSKYVFTDISPHIQNEERIIVVREANGVLRTALKNEKFRMNQVYFPIPGREMEVPEMFETKNLLNVILRKDYEFILDRACAQFEPDEAIYHEVITLTYEAINYCKDFDMLLSTRHFGSLVFYLVTHKNLNNLLEHNLKNNRLEDAISLVSLYCIIHPESELAKTSKGKSDSEILADFISLSSSDVLRDAYKTFLNIQKSKKDLEKEIKEAHGY